MSLLANLHIHTVSLLTQILDNPVPRKEYVSGESFLYLGQHFELTLVDDVRAEVQQTGKQFRIGRADAKKGDDLLRRWYLAKAKEELQPRIASIAVGMGVSYSRIWVRDLKYRWGSCSPGGTLSFNWRIIQAPMVVIDYLIVHELAHLLVANHSDDFWNIVAVHSPGWKKAKVWLQRHGAQLDW